MDGIVVGVDGSAGALTAMRWAVREGSLRGLPVTVVHASGPDPVSAPVGWTDDEVSEYDTGTLLADLVRTARTEGWAAGVELRTAALEGRAAKALLHAAVGADQLVVGGRGSDGLSRLMLGSVSDQVLHHAQGTVTVVPAKWTVGGADALGDGAVVVGVDGSAESRAALSHAAREATARHTRLRVVRVRLPLRTDPGPDVLPGPGNPLETAERAAQDLLAREIRDVLGEAGAGEVDAEVHVGRPAAGLLAAAEDAALLVVGGRGRGGFTGLLLGSVSRQCVHHAGRPTTVVRAT